MCVCGGAPDDYKGLGLVDHMSSGDRGVCVCLCLCVYRHASAGLSIHVNTSKTPKGMAVCCGLLVKKMGKLKEVTDVLGNKENAIQIK